MKLKHLISRIEPQVKELKEPILKYLERKKDGSAELAGIILSLVTVDTPYFDYPAAEKKLGKEKLAPFWKKRSHKRVNVK